MEKKVVIDFERKVIAGCCKKRDFKEQMMNLKDVVNDEDIFKNKEEPI